MSFWTLLASSAPVLGLMVAGFAVRRVGWLSEEADASLLRLVVKLLYPCLVFTSVVDNEAARAPHNLVTAPVAGIASLLLGFSVAWAAGRLVRLRPGPERRTFTFIAGIQNYAYVAIPIVQQLFPGALGVLFLFTLGVELTIWSAGLAIVSGAAGAGAWRRAMNPTVGAIVLGVALGLAGLAPALPRAVVTGLHMLGSSAVPLGLLLIGATVADELRGVGAGKATRPWRAAAAGHVLRLGLIPLLLLLVTRALPLSTELRQVMVVQAAMPAAVMPVVLAKHHAGDTAVAVWIAVGTNLLALLTIPLWIRLGMLIAGL